MDLSGLILSHEAYRPRVYCDRCGQDIRANEGLWMCGCSRTNAKPGHPTVAIGIKLDGAGISYNEACGLLSMRVAAIQYELVRKTCFARLDQVRQAALTDMAYTMGVEGCLLFVRMWRHLRDHDYHGAADEVLNSAWLKEAPERCRQIAEMIRTGQWPDNISLLGVDHGRTR